MLRRLKEPVGLIVSAGLASLPIHDGAWGALAFVALVPFFWILSGKSSTAAFRAAFLWGFFFALFTGYPLAIVTVAGYVGVAAYVGLFVGIFGWAAAPWLDPSAQLPEVFASRDLRTLAFVPAAWVLTEYVRGFLFSGLPLFYLSYTQWRNPVFLQIADSTGAAGVSFFVVFANALAYKLLREPFKRLLQRRYASPVSFRRKHEASLLVAAAAAFALVGGYGLIRLAEWDAFARSSAPKAVLRVSVVQGNVPQEQKWDARIKGIIFEKYKRLTLMAAMEQPDLIVWPETSFPGYLEDELTLAPKLRALARASRTNMLVGAPTLGDIESRGVRFFNSAVLFGPDGEEVKRYDKLHLVPFGEYVPLEFAFGLVRRFVHIGDFDPGKERTVFTVKSRFRERPITARFSTLICYEDMFAPLVRSFVRGGADFLVNITNDAWFGDTSAPYQHAQASILRAVENRVPVVRAGNTGWSCFIGADGRVMGAVSDKGKETFVSGHKSMDLTLRRARSLYTRVGDLFVLLCAVLCFLGYRDRMRHSAYAKF